MNNKLLNKIKHPFLLIILVSILFIFVIPNSVQALIFDLANVSLEGVEEKVKPISSFLVNTAILYVKSLAFLTLFTYLFDISIWLNLEMVSVQEEIVTFGWGFVSGIANMFLILIFVICALAIILKIESFPAKKILPNLIIVALLMNFSLVFIGMLIDITNIIYSTLLPPGETITMMREFAQPLLSTGTDSALAIIAALVALAILFAIPYISTAAQIGLVSSLVAILPVTIIIYFHIGIFLLLSAIFGLYTAVFAARIFVIQILAILSPLAFLCFILPNTKKFWDMWLKWLLEWIFVGILLLFFLRLGFLLFEVLARVSGPGFLAGNPLLQTIGGYVVFYVFVAIYLGVTLFIAKKFMPEFAQAGINAAKGVFTKGAIVKGILMGRTSLAKQAQMIAPKVGHGVEKIGERIQTHGRKGGGFWRWAERRIGKRLITGGRGAAIWGELACQEELKKRREEIGKETTDEIISTVDTAGSQLDQMASLLLLCEKGKSKKLLDYMIKKYGGGEDGEKKAKERIKALYTALKDRGLEEEEVVAHAFPQLHKEFGITNLDELVGDIAKKPELIRNMHPGAYDNPELKKIILKKFGGRQIAEVAKSSDEAREKIELIFEEEIERVGFEQFAQENPSAARYLASGAAQGAGLRDIIHLSDDKIKKILQAEVRLKRNIEEIEKDIAAKRKELDELHQEPGIIVGMVNVIKEIENEIRQLEEEKAKQQKT